MKAQNNCLMSARVYPMPFTPLCKEKRTASPQSVKPNCKRQPHDNLPKVYSVKTKKTRTSFNRLIVEKPIEYAPIIKTKVLEEAGFELIGEDWQTTEIIIFGYRANSQLVNWISKGKPLIVHNIWRLLILLSLIGFYIWQLRIKAKNDTAIGLVLLYSLIVIDLMYSLTILISILSLSNRAINIETVQISLIWIHMFHCSVCISLFLNEFFFKNSLWWVFLLGSQIVNITQLISLYIWIIVSPIIFAYGIMETIYRLFTCKLKCPKLEKMGHSYTYGLYEYNKELLLSGVKFLHYLSRQFCRRREKPMFIAMLS